MADQDIAALERRIAWLEGTLRTLLANGLSAGLTSNIFGTSTGALDGTSPLGARKDHSH